MKALIRNTGETVFEMDNIEGIDWTTGAPLTNEAWCGGSYAIAPYCPPDAEPEDFDIVELELTDGRKFKAAKLNEQRYAAKIAAEVNEE